MTENNTESFVSILEITKRAKNDSEKFAALLVVSKLLKADSLSIEMRRQIFQAVGFSFPLRLIGSKQEDDTNSNMLVGLGLSVLSSFASDSELAGSPEMVQALPTVLSIFGRESSESEENYTVNDCLLILSATAEENNCCKTILRHNGVKILCQFYAQSLDEDANNMVWGILLSLIKNDPVFVLDNNTTYVLQILQSLSETVKSLHNERKFELFHQLCSFLDVLPESLCETYFCEQWISIIADSLFEVLASRVSEKQRIPAIMLCSSLTQAYDLKWTTFSKHKGNKLVVLLTRLATIEVTMALYEKSDTDEISANLFSKEVMILLLACFNILENTLSAVAVFDQTENDNSIFAFDDIKCIEPALNDTAKLVGEFLSTLCDSNKQEDFLLVCLRFLGGWLNVGSFAASKTGVNIATTFISAFEKSFATFSHEVILNICVPAFMNYIETSETLQTIVDSQVIEILSSCILDSQLPKDVVILVSQCLIQFIIESNQSELFHTKVSEICQIVLKENLPQNLDLRLTISCLVLLIWNKSKLSFKEITCGERVFHSIISTIYCLHAVNGNTVEISKRFKDHAETSEQLFPILMQELTKAAQENEVLQLIQKSTFLDKVETIVKLSGNESNDTIQAYHNFQTCICQKIIK